MSADSKIEWCDATWNPVRGCEAVSPGCLNCYAAKDALRHSGEGRPYEGLAKKNAGDLPIWTGEVRTVAHKLQEPFSWKKPKRIFVNSMSDLFHKDVPFEFIDQVFAVMNASCITLPATRRSKRWHTYLVLTKRVERMHEYIRSRSTRKFGPGKHPIFAAGRDDGGSCRGLGGAICNAAGVLNWPLLNLWLGVSIEDRKRLVERAPILARTAAAVRFWSVEPLLEDLGDVRPFLRGVEWVIVGGESGPRARPMHPDWVRSLRDQCVDAGVAFFFKQWGQWEPNAGFFGDRVGMSGQHYKPKRGEDVDAHLRSIKESSVPILRVGKKAAGRRLDGREWSEFPRKEFHGRVSD